MPGEGKQTRIPLGLYNLDLDRRTRESEAWMATAALTSMDDYLKTSYERDVEYVNGELKERPVVFSVHGLLQMKIGSWFDQHEEEWGVRAGVEVRTQVSPARVRLPDVVVDHARYWPAVLVSPPMVAIEILSPSDTYGHIQDVIYDYRKMGVANIWVLDPEARTAHVCQATPWVPVSRFLIEDSPVYLDAPMLFAWIDRYKPE